MLIELLYRGHWTVCSYRVASWKYDMTRALHKLARLEGQRHLGSLFISNEVDSAIFVWRALSSGESFAKSDMTSIERRIRIFFISFRFERGQKFAYCSTTPLLLEAFQRNMLIIQALHKIPN